MRALSLEGSLQLASLERWRHLARAQRRGEGSWKDWHHVLIVGDGTVLLANLSCAGSPDRADRAGGRQGAVAFLVLLNGVWTGTVLRGLPARVRPGSLKVEVGPATLNVVGDITSLDTGQLEGSAAQLQLRALSRPLASPASQLGDGSFQWLTIPEMEGDGRLCLQGRIRHFRGAAAYLDQNWGAWSWGGDFSWQWVWMAPMDGWVAVFSRMLDRARIQERSVRLMLWRDGAPVRCYQASEITVKLDGIWRGRPSRFPSSAFLLARGESTDVPQRFSIRAQRDGDLLELDLACQSVAQLAVPNETDLDVTWISEVAADVVIAGRVGSATLRGRSAAILEIVHGA